MARRGERERDRDILKEHKIKVCHEMEVNEHVYF